MGQNRGQSPAHYPPPSLAATGRYWCRTAHIVATETAFPEGNWPLLVGSPCGGDYGPNSQTLTLPQGAKRC